MERRDSGHSRRVRRFGAAAILAVVGLTMTFVVELWPDNSPIIGHGLSWLLVIGLSGIALTLIGVGLTLSVLSELRRLQAERGDNDEMTSGIRG